MALDIREESLQTCHFSLARRLQDSKHYSNNFLGCHVANNIEGKPEKKAWIPRARTTHTAGKNKGQNCIFTR